MRLSLATIDQHGVIHVNASGAMTAAGIPADGKDPFELALGANWRSNRVLLNLAAVSYMDSCAIGWLISGHREFKQGGGRLVLHSIQPAVRQILDLLKIGNLLTLAEDEQAARQIITAGGIAA